MPGWSVHSKAYNVLGLATSTCQVIDKIVDKEPPKVREVLTQMNSDERLPIHFGFHKTEFPYVCGYIVKNFGLEGAKCLLTHFIIDRIENTLKKGYTYEMVKNDIIEFLEGYKEECRIAEEQCIACEAVFNEVEQQLREHVDIVIKIVEEWVKEKVLPVEILVNASTGILSLIVRVNLYLRGYRAKHGFRVNSKAFRKTYNKAKQSLRQSIFQAMLSREITDLDKILESINEIKQRITDKGRMTISEYLDLIKQEQQKNIEFKRYIEIIKEVVKQAMEEL